MYKQFFPDFSNDSNACVYMLAFLNLFIKMYFLNAQENIQVEQDHLTSNDSSLFYK